jgi:hypothetical protein
MNGQRDAFSCMFDLEVREAITTTPPPRPKVKEVKQERFAKRGTSKETKLVFTVD